ncbi:hypothetical protein YW3DRAFT_06331 [Streptomyces sp. MnatMP-M77]|uniref:hypothetical protein n=1 Tax=Streptomyces TaxID=1883 RepID=UPI000805F539|nr:hypothetical protein [Streptomyces sp. MnatMP-M77]SBU98556.1 hypothetical protein YW3DRAFT_06331 [Streptomyces sp. MnatMP-M77]
MKPRKAIAAAAALSALFAVSACSGTSAESSDHAKTSKKSTPLPAEAKAEAEAERIGAMTPQALERATLSGKESNFEAKKVAKADVEAGRDMRADKAECQPLASLAGGYTHIPAVAVEHRALEPVETTNATVGSMWLASHSERNAKKVLAEVRTSLQECPDGFKTLGLTYTSVKAVKAPALGDEAVGYRITNVVGKQKVSMTYTLVRKDGVVAVFYGVNMLTPEKSAIPDSVVRGQMEKLG